MKNGLTETEEIPYNQEIKYKDLCRIFNFKNTNGGYINRNLIKIKKEYLLEKNGRKYIIISKLNTPTYKILDSRFCIPYEKKNMSGIYIIQKNNDVYIGQTNNFFNRFTRHKRGDGGKEHTKTMLDNNATFKILEIENDREQRLIKETEYIKEYVNLKYNVFNSLDVLYDKKNKKQLKYKEQRIGITFNKSDLDKIVKLLSDNNIEFKQHKFRDKKESSNVQFN